MMTILYKLRYYSKIWWLLTKASASVVVSQKIAMLFFLAGKIIRFVLFFTFLTFLIKGTKSLAGYSPNQVLFFFLTFNLVDVLAQLFFRDVYRFRPKIISGDFDLTLLKPLSPLFMSLMGWGIDLMDFLTVPPLLIITAYVGYLLHPSFLEIVIFLILLINSFVIAAAFHIAVLALGIISLEVDHTIMMYRDITSFGRFPVDIYKYPLQGILTFLIPVGVMITFPAKAFMGLLGIGGIISSVLIGVIAIFLSFKFWNFALKKYTSASS